MVSRYFVPVISMKQMITHISNLMNKNHRIYFSGSCFEGLSSLFIESYDEKIEIGDNESYYTFRQNGRYECFVCPELNLNSEEVKPLREKSK